MSTRPRIVSAFNADTYAVIETRTRLMSVPIARIVRVMGRGSRICIAALRRCGGNEQALVPLFSPALGPRRCRQRNKG